MLLSGYTSAKHKINVYKEKTTPKIYGFFPGTQSVVPKTTAAVELAGGVQ